MTVPEAYSAPGGLSSGARYRISRLVAMSSSELFPRLVSRRWALRLGGGLAAAASLASVSRAHAQAVVSGPTPSASPSPAGTATPAPTATPTAASAAATATATPAAAPWVQSLRPIQLWSGPDDSAIEFGIAPRWDYFQVVKPQSGSRLYVYVARSRDYAWVDALSVGPSGPPPPNWPPDSSEPISELIIGWVATFGDVPLWAYGDGTGLLGMAPMFTPLKQIEVQNGLFLAVEDPFSGGHGYVRATDVGAIGAPDLITPVDRWWGVLAVDGANLRAEPTTQSEAVLQLPDQAPIIVSAWVAGEEYLPDNPTWAQLGDGAYLHSSVFRPVALPAVPSPSSEGISNTGRWIDLNLTHQVVVAYEGSTPVRMATTSTGRPTWETPPGQYAIQRRVENETMESTSLIGLDASRADYKVENVRWTQYFSADGMALHENYWKPRDTFGIPSSHGCAGLVAEDAKFFWDWASVGTPIYAHP